jgi:hypothetical protein
LGGLRLLTDPTFDPASETRLFELLALAVAQAPQEFLHKSSRTNCHRARDAQPPDNLGNSADFARGGLRCEENSRFYSPAVVARLSCSAIHCVIAFSRGAI